MKQTIKLSLISVTFLSSLNAQDITLDEITVTSATKSEHSLKDLTSNISVITKEDIQEKHYTSVTQALNTLTGVNFTSNGGLGSTTSLYIRGASNSRTLILIDGVRYNDPSSTTGANIGHLMIEDIEKIELIKGAQSGIWGADAAAGVINIITKKAKEGTNVSVNIEGGSFTTKKYGAIISHKEEKFDVKLSANKITSNGFSSLSPRGEDVNQYEDDAYSNLTLNLNINYNITDDAKIGINLTRIDALKDYDSYANPDDDTLQSDVLNKLYELSYLQNYKNHNFSLKLQKSDFARDEIGTVAQWGSEYVKKFNGEHINIEFMDTISYNENDFLTFGFGRNSDDVNYIMTDSAKTQKKNRDYYAYATNSNDMKKIIFTQSIRYDDYNNFDSKATGKIGVKYNINQDTFITSNIGLAYNTPTIVQELNPWGAVNSELNPENTKSFDITLAYKNFKATYFYNVVTDLIEWYDPDGWGGNPAIFKNLDGESLFRGYEFEYAQNLSDTLTTSLNLTLLNAQDKDDKKLARRADETIKVSVDYYPTDSLHLGVFGEYIGTRYDKADKQGAQTGKYTVVNFVSNYDVNQKLSIYVKVDNILDREYQVVDGYATAKRSGYLGLNAKF